MSLPYVILVSIIVFVFGWIRGASEDSFTSFIQRMTSKDTVKEEILIKSIDDLRKSVQDINECTCGVLPRSIDS